MVNRSNSDIEHILPLPASTPPLRSRPFFNRADSDIYTHPPTRRSPPSYTLQQAPGLSSPQPAAQHSREPTRSPFFASSGSNLTLAEGGEARPSLKRSSSADSDRAFDEFDYSDDELQGSDDEQEQEHEEEHYASARRFKALKSMTYEQRKKEQAKIQYNITPIANRCAFILTHARALMASAVLAHRIDKQLKNAARVLDIKIELSYSHDTVDVTFPDSRSYSRKVQQSGGTNLGAIRDMHTIYLKVLRDEICAKQGTAELKKLLKRPAVYGKHTLALIQFCLSTLICPLAFGGSFADMWISGAFSAVLLYMRSAQVMTQFEGSFELCAAFLISFIARALASIPSSPFCYVAISSAAIISILPGYLIVGAVTEVMSKQLNSGSSKFVYAVIYSVLLGFGLRYGSETYLLLNPHARALIKDASSPYMVGCCYRPPGLPWYQQVFPFWAQFFLVPLFSIGVSLANQQPWRKPALPAMVFISCASYAAHKAAEHFIIGRADVSGAIGASVCAVLGLVYSRWTNGPALQVMVPGILLMVPSGLAQTGGLTVGTYGFDFDTAKLMVIVSATITLGLLLTQALLTSIFRKNKHSAVWSF